MALRNYLYAKHANDQFALSLMHKDDIKDVHLESKPAEQNSNTYKDIEESHEKCDNCADCKDCKTKKAKVNIELEATVQSLEHSLKEIDFTHKI